MKKKDFQPELNAGAAKVLKLLSEAGYEAYLVGGSVRDLLRGKTPKDWDITTSAMPEEIKSVFNATIDTGIKHGTVTVRMYGENFEVTTYRVDGSYEDHRHPTEVSFTRSLKEDLKRRDFTVNAMAYNPETGLVDLFGGQRDLRRGIIRAVGTPKRRFEEDALRILRAVRFAASQDFDIAKRTLRAAAEKGKNLQDVSRERVFEELNKALCSDNPEKLEIALNLEILPYCIGPEIPSAERIRMLPQIENTRLLRWSLFLSELTPEGAEAVLTGLKTDNELKRDTVRLLEFLARPLPADEYTLRLELARIEKPADRGYYEKMLKLRRLIRPNEDLSFVDKALTEQLQMPLFVQDLALQGKDLIALGVPSGPGLGELLGALLERVLKQPELNAKEELTKLLEEIK